MEGINENVTQVKGILRLCCADPKNLTGPQPTFIPDEVFRVCTVCGRRHFSMKADTGKLGIIPSGVSY